MWLITSRKKTMTRKQGQSRNKSQYLASDVLKQMAPWKGLQPQFFSIKRLAYVWREVQFIESLLKRRFRALSTFLAWKSPIWRSMFLFDNTVLLSLDIICIVNVLFPFWQSRILVLIYPDLMSVDVDRVLIALFQLTALEWEAKWKCIILFPVPRNVVLHIWAPILPESAE